MSIIPDTFTILVVDDEPDIHAVTQLTLKSLSYKERKVEIVSASSGNEALEHMRNHPDTALILMDVVMESDIAGLEACRLIREELNNDTVRILLRTGQPGHAPEKTVIESYEIDGYLAKAEMTNTRLFTAARTALKAFTELRTVKWLESILTFLHHASSSLQFSGHVGEMLEEVLMISQEIVPSDWAAIHLNFEQEVNDQLCYTAFNGLALAEEEQPQRVTQLIQSLKVHWAEGPVFQEFQHDEGYVFPLSLPPEIGYGWLYIHHLELENAVAKSAVLKAVEMLLHQTSSALYNNIIREQTAELEACMGLF